jgi:amino acid permease
MLVDAVALLSLAWVCYDAVDEYSALASDVAASVVVFVAVALFVAGAMSAYRRRRMALAITLAAVPAVPAILLAIALGLFVATFTHHQ